MNIEHYLTEARLDKLIKRPLSDTELNKNFRKRFKNSHVSRFSEV